MKRSNEAVAEWDKDIFHFPFAIFHLSLQRITQWQISNGKWKMENEKAADPRLLTTGHWPLTTGAR